jgi:hypothetical protein
MGRGKKVFRDKKAGHHSISDAIQTTGELGGQRVMLGRVASAFERCSDWEGRV